MCGSNIVQKLASTRLLAGKPLGCLDHVLGICPNTQMLVCVYACMLGLRPHSGDHHSHACMLVCFVFIHTLEIVARTLSYGVDIDRLYGTNTLLSMASAIFGAVKPIEEVPTQSICVWFVGFFLFVCLFVGIKLEKL